MTPGSNSSEWIDTMAIYLDYEVDELERLYDVTMGVPDVEGIQARYREASDAVVDSGLGVLDIPYGDDPLQRLDVFAPSVSGAAPVMVYIHGGYWKGGEKAGRRFPAPLFNDSGIAWISINYRLTPTVTIDAIVDDARSALAWVYANAAGHGCDRDRISISGSSAGGHLVGMLLAPGWHRDYGVPPDVIKGACVMSGVFALEPLRLIPTGAHLALDRDAALRNSPIAQIPETLSPTIVAWGANETDEFCRQSQAYADTLRDWGHVVETVVADGHDHFSLMGEMGRSVSPIARAMLALAGGAP